MQGEGRGREGGAGQAPPSKLFCFFFEKVSTLKGKKLFPIGVDPFLEQISKGELHFCRFCAHDGFG